MTFESARHLGSSPVIPAWSIRALPSAQSAAHPKAKGRMRPVKLSVVLDTMYE